MGRRRYRHRAPREHQTCEVCGEGQPTRWYVIDLRDAHDEPRNRVRLCETCRGMAQSDALSRGSLRIVAAERVERELIAAMDHSAYTREGHGAIRQIHRGG